jgi:hypothetical protein
MRNQPNAHQSGGLSLDGGAAESFVEAWKCERMSEAAKRRDSFRPLESQFDDLAFNAKFLDQGAEAVIRQRRTDLHQFDG